MRWVLGAPCVTMRWVEALVREHGHEVVWAQSLEADPLVCQAVAAGFVDEAQLQELLTPLRPGETPDWPVASSDDVWVGIQPPSPSHPLANGEVHGGGLKRGQHTPSGPPVCLERDASQDVREFLGASLIGQVYARLQGGEGTYVFEEGAWGLQVEQAGDVWSYRPSEELVRAAAAEHALVSAYQGGCPGVEGEALLVQRIRELASLHGMREQVVQGQMFETLSRLDRATALLIGGWSVLDVRHQRLMWIEDVCGWSGHAAIEVRVEDPFEVRLVGAGPGLLACWPAWCEVSGLAAASLDLARGVASAQQRDSR